MKTSIRKEQGGIPKAGATNDALKKLSSTDYDVDWGAILSGGSGGTKLYIDTTQTALLGSVAETTLFTTNIPGGILGVNNAIRFEVPLSFVGDSGNHILRVKYGGTTVATLSSSYADTPGSAVLRGVIIADAATGLQKAMCELIITPANDGDVTKIIINQYGTAAINSTIAQTLEITGQNSNLLGVLTSEAIIVEVITDASSGIKFGGTGADGALSISAGTTTIDLTGLAIFELNYTSIAITGTADLKFINPHANGTVLIIKSQGDVTLTSSATPMIDCSGLGADGGTGGVQVSQVANDPGSAGADGRTSTLITVAGAGGTPGTAGTKPTAYEFSVNYIASQVYKQRYPNMSVGSGAGGGQAIKGLDAVDTAIGGDGGKGGGCLIIECRGAWNFTTAGGISVAGLDGTNGSSIGVNDVAGAGGGGGGGGSFLALYNILTANTGTINVSGGIGGNTLQTYVANPTGGGGGASGINNGNSGTSPAGSGQSGGDGATGDSIVLFNSEYA